ncbi:MAG: thymidylate kinase [Promethearchaeota archaeon]
MTINKKQRHIPLFIVVDGGDGCGKDTQTRRIAQYYLKKGWNVRIRSHPSTDNPFGRFTRQSLEEGGRRGHLKAALFYAIDVIRSLVKYYRHNEDEVIIFSRYLLGVCYLPTTLVFFGYNFFSTFLPTSRYFFFLDVTPELARERISKRGKDIEMFETLARLRKIRRKMKLVTTQKNWFLIDGSASPSKVWNQIHQVLNYLNSKNI